MPLLGSQPAELALVLGRELDLPGLSLVARDALDIDLSRTIDPSGTSYEVAVNFITHVVSLNPPGDDRLLAFLRGHPNGALRRIAERLSKHDWFGPTQDPLDAIALGKTAFVDRSSLRDQLEQFVNPSPATTRLLIIRGEEPCGKSYSFEFLRHFVLTVARGSAPRLQLKDKNFTPRTFLQNAFALLGITVDATTMKDDPQEVLVSPAISSFRNQISDLTKTYWLIIDDLNDPSVTRSVRETAFALAALIDEARSDRLSIALIGYNHEIGADYRNVAVDDAVFPTPKLVAQYFFDMASQSPPQLPIEQAQQYADAAFSGFPTIDKAAMTELTGIIETMGAKLAKGLRP